MSKSSYVLAGVGILSASTAVKADWYSGDPYATNPAIPLAAFYSPPTFEGRAFETFAWSGGGIDRLGGHYFDFNSNSPTTVAHWEIRTGVAPATPGTILYSGTGVPVVSTTGFMHGANNISRFELDIPDFNLPAGSYFFTMSVDSGWFVANTSGVGSMNAMPTDNSCIYSNTNNPLDPYYYKEMGTGGLEYAGVDPSYFIISSVPEPMTLTLAGAVATSALRRVRRTAA